MKKYTYTNSKWVLLGMIVPILMFFFAMNSVYAYFTATAQQKNATIKTGSIMLQFTDGINATSNSTAVVDGAIIYPGQSFDFAGTIKNTGSSAMYAIVVCEIVQVDGETETVISTSYYTPNGTALTKNDQDQYVGAQEMAKDVTASFTISHSFGFNDYGNEFNGKQFKFVFKARGIQTVKLTADTATKLLVEMA